MNRTSYKIKNSIYKVCYRIIHPWPIYKKVGGIDAIIIKEDGTKQNLGRLSTTYASRFGGWSK